MIRAWAAAAAWAAVACTVEPPELGSRGDALIGGEVVPGDEEPAVVALEGSLLCTGTLVSPSVVATAGHCIGGFAGIVHFGNDLNGGGRKVMMDRALAHPGWTGALGANDIGIIVLSFAQDPALPIALNESPIEDHIGDDYRLIGFGINDRVTGEIDGLKRRGLFTITGVRSTGDNLTITGQDGAATCSGDSGGPGLLTVDGVEYLAGVHSWGTNSPGMDCIAPHGDTRVDLHLDWLREQIDTQDPSCGANGVCARIGCTADPDCEPCGPEGTCVDDCAIPDPDCATAELGELCQADTQCVSGVCVYWQEDPGTKFCTQACDGDGDCPSGMSCVSRPDVGKVCYYDDAPDGVLGDACTDDLQCGSGNCDEGSCVRTCDLSIGLRCPSEFECRVSAETPGAYHCFLLAADDGGGCSAAPRGATWWSVLAALAVIRRRRRAC